VAVYQSAYKAHILRLDNEFEIRRELANIGVDKKAFDILTQKMSYLHIKVEKVDTRAANLIKQYLSAIGGEAAISQSAYAYTERTTDMIISASRKNIFLLIKKIQEDRYGLSEIAKEIEKSLFSSVGAIKLGNNILDFNKSTYIMGTISLFKSSSLEPASEKSILKKVDGFVKAGANIIDICDECFYKENSEDKDANELLPRVVSIVKQIKERFPGVILSIDTIKINVAKECLDAGIDIINNSIPLKYNEELINLIAKVKCPMIMIFNPTLITDQPKPLISISDVIREIQSNVSYALGKGVDKDKIIIDPGIGFGRSDRDNFLILKQLSGFKYFNMPILVGLSRKSFLREALKGKMGSCRLSALAANTMAIINGANIVRTHSSGEALTMRNVIESIKKTD